MRIKAIVFDFGSVIFKTNWEGVNKDFLKKYGKGILVRGNKELEEVYIKTKAGYKSLKPLLKHIFPNEDLKKIIRFYQKSYNKNKIINRGLIKFAKKLSKNYRLYGFTDTNEEHFGANLKSGLFKGFKQIFTSFEFKSKKAEGNTFRKLILKIKLKPEEMLFIDDYILNIENARKAGINAIQYTEFPKINHLKKEINKFLK